MGEIRSLIEQILKELNGRTDEEIISFRDEWINEYRVSERYSIKAEKLIFDISDIALHKEKEQLIA